MSSHQLAIAKASFAAGLLRPDPTSLTRSEIAYFDTLLHNVLSQCTPANIQNCKRWVLSNVIFSTARSAAFGKYLIALSTSFTGPSKPAIMNTSWRKPSSQRKCLHLLYLINDLLHHTIAHNNDPSITGNIQNVFPGLLTIAASFKNRSKHTRKILDLLNIWEDKKYYAPSFIDKLRDIVRTAPDSNHAAVASESLANADNSMVLKTAPFIMPALHGDVTTPWYDLPAGNFMPHIVPNSTRPLNPTLVRPLRFSTGPANEILVSAVKSLLQDVTLIYGTSEAQGIEDESTLDIDELGQPVTRDDKSEEALVGDGYYGWSKSFCLRMKMRRKGTNSHGLENPPERRHQSIGRSISCSRSSSPDSVQSRIRRYSPSTSADSRSRSLRRGRAGRRSYSRSRSPSRGNDNHSQKDWRSRTPQKSRSPSISRGGSGRVDSLVSDVSISAERGWPFPKRGTEASRQARPDYTWTSQSDGMDHHHAISPPPLLISGAFHHSAGVTPLPLPPPPPPHFQGQWPPLPPPPPVVYGQNPQSNGIWSPLPQSSQVLLGPQNWQLQQPYGQALAGTALVAPPAEYSGNQVRVAMGEQQYKNREQGYSVSGRGRGNARGRGWS